LGSSSIAFCGESLRLGCALKALLTGAVYLHRSTEEFRDLERPMAGPAPTFSFRFVGLTPLTALGACAALTAVAPPAWAEAPAMTFARTVAANDQTLPAPTISATPSAGLQALDYRIVRVASTVSAEAPAPAVPLDPVFTWR
jgi:hypothetical protein